MRARFDFDGKRLIVDEVHTQEEFSEFLGTIRLKPPFIVKPNWLCEDYGYFTDPQVLEWTLRSLHENGETVLVESYSARNMLAVPELRPPIWRFSEDGLGHVRKSEENFLRKTGTKNVIGELKIEYVNVAEEVLAKRTVDKETVKETVEKKYSAVLRDELYEFLPEKLYALRKGTFIDLAKLKVVNIGSKFFTLCTKNLFGLIPEHVGYESRGRYHGKGDEELSRNIVDVNKIYRAFFTVVGIVEGINSLNYDIGKGGSHKSCFGYRYYVLENKGLIYYSDDPLWLDAFVHQHWGKNPMDVEHLELASKVFGEWPLELIREAKNLGTPVT